MGASQSRSNQRDQSALPPDATQRVASYLLGVEVIQFAHSGPAFFAALNDPHVWTHRLEPDVLQAFQHPESRTAIPPFCCLEKAIYLRQRAFLFRGPPARKWSERLRYSTPIHAGGDSVPISSTSLQSLRPQFSFELTFSLFSPQANAHIGGILLGSQDTNCESITIPTEFFTVASVDANGGLHIASEKANTFTAVAANVTFDEWHHLVVAFDGRYMRAYLDGVLRFFKRLPRGSPLLSQGQVGTGFGYNPNRTLATHADQRVAWRPFHGLIADVRAWDNVIDEASAKELARGVAVTQQPIWSLQGQRPGPPRVLASRLCEKYACVIGG